MELKWGTELDDEQAKAILKKQYSFSSYGLSSIFLYGVMAMLGMVAILALSSAIQGYNIVSNVIGVLVFGTGATVAFRFARKQWGRHKKAIEDVQNDKFLWREAVVIEKHESFKKLKNGQRRYFGVLYFPDKDDPNKKERVEVSIERYESVQIGDLMYVIYIQSENIPIALPKSAPESDW